MQDSDNSQTGDFVEVFLPWPSSTDASLSVPTLLSRFPGRSLAVRIQIGQTDPAIDWIVTPTADVNLPTWEYAVNPLASLSNLHCARHIEGTTSEPVCALRVPQHGMPSEPACALRVCFSLPC